MCGLWQPSTNKRQNWALFPGTKRYLLPRMWISNMVRCRVNRAGWNMTSFEDQAMIQLCPSFFNQLGRNKAVIHWQVLKCLLHSLGYQGVTKWWPVLIMSYNSEKKREGHLTLTVTVCYIYTTHKMLGIFDFWSLWKCKKNSWISCETEQHVMLLYKY